MTMMFAMTFLIVIVLIISPMVVVHVASVFVLALCLQPAR